MILILIFNLSIEAKLLDEKSVVKPCDVTDDELEVVHTKRYLDSLRVTEILF